MSWPDPTCASPATRAAIDALHAEFCHRLDREHGRSVHELFEPGGNYVIDGVALMAPEDLRSGFAEREARGPRTARHFTHNLRIVVEAVDRLEVTSTMVLHACDGEPVHPATPPLVIADVVDDCVRDLAGTWRFARRELTTLFRGDGPVVTPTTKHGQETP